MSIKRRKKRKIKKKVIVIIIIIVLVISSLIYLNYSKEELKDSKDVSEDNIKEEVYTISLIMVGDALINDLLYNSAYQDGTYNFKPYLSYIKEKVSNYNIAYYNQETILGGVSIGLSSYPAFNSPQEFGDAMIDAGFNLVSLATNHTLDRGESAIALSREYWNNQEGVHAVGSYTSIDEKIKLETTIKEVNNITYAMLNYTYGTNGITIPTGKEYLVNLWSVDYNYEEYKEKVKEDINAIRDKVDILLVAMHWGVEYTHTPTTYEVDMAHFLAENGADIIIGTHPHVIQPVEWIDKTLVIYSLGNFISSQTSSACTYYKCNIGLMTSLEITKVVNEEKTDITIDNIENELIYTYNNNNQNYLVIPFSNQDITKYLNNYQEVYEYYTNIIKTDEERISIVPVAN